MNWSRIGTVVVILVIGAKILHAGSRVSRVNRVSESRNMHCQSLQTSLNSQSSSIETANQNMDKWSNLLDEKKERLEARIENSFSMSPIERESLIGEAEAFEIEIARFNESGQSLSSQVDAYNQGVARFNSECVKKSG